MSQNDFTIANQSFPAFRADLNSALQALASNSSGGSAPSTTFANMWWYDSSNNIMYIRNEDNDAWIKFAELDQANDKFVLSGTLQLDDGTVSAPALTFNSDTNMGIYRGGTDILKFVTAGADAITINASQDVGIGIATPQRTLHLHEPSSDSNYLHITNNTTGTTSTDGMIFGMDGSEDGYIWHYESKNLTIATNNQQAMKIANNGDISFYEDTGTTPKLFWDASAESLLADRASSGYMFETSGGIRAGIRSDDQNNLTLRAGTDAIKMHVGADGNVGIGTSSPSGAAGTTLAINGGSGQSRLALKNTSTGDASGDGFQLSVGTDGSVGIEQRENNYMALYTNATEAMRISSNQAVSVGTTSNTYALNVGGSGSDKRANFQGSNQYRLALQNGTNNLVWLGSGGADNFRISNSAGSTVFDIDSNGNVSVGKTSFPLYGSAGCSLSKLGTLGGTADGDSSLILNRNSDDGTIAQFRQANTLEGTISVSGTTVSYNGGHLSRFSQLADNSRDNTIVKGTVMTNLDQMAEWTTDGVTEDNEQLNCMAVSSVEGDANVAGVFVNWDNDDDYNDMNIAMTGDMVIRIAQGTTVSRGDLLMSAGDGTAKPQGDDIVRSKTIAKVTSTNVSHTYDDGTYLVPCVLMAC